MNVIDRVDRVTRKDRTERRERKDGADRRVPVDRTREPIYAQLVREWRAQGRTVPAQQDVLWATLAGFALRTRPEPERRP
jgi:hypothetical protein